MNWLAGLLGNIGGGLKGLGGGIMDSFEGMGNAPGEDPAELSFGASLKKALPGMALGALGGLTNGRGLDGVLGGAAGGGMSALYGRRPEETSLRSGEKGKVGDFPAPTGSQTPPEILPPPGGIDQEEILKRLQFGGGAGIYG
jgi:hypothetical protein